jgi:hypothetical protein
MASGLALIFHEDGSIEATPELKEKLQLASGSRLELVQQDGAEFRFRAPSEMRVIHGWRDLEGILADSSSGYERRAKERAGTRTRVGESPGCIDK